MFLVCNIKCDEGTKYTLVCAPIILDNVYIRFILHYFYFLIYTNNNKIITINKQTIFLIFEAQENPADFLVHAKLNTLYLRTNFWMKTTVT